MSEEQESSRSSEAECSARALPEFEDEERWLFEDNIGKQEDGPLSHAESLFHLQDILQEDKVSSTDDACQTIYTEEDDEISHSDSDTDDNVNVIIGTIKINPALYMEMLTNLNSQTDQDLEVTASGIHEGGISGQWKGEITESLFCTDTAINSTD